MSLRPYIAAALAIAVCCGAAPAFSQGGKFPERTIRIVVPFAAGGGVDTLARLMAERMQAKMGVNVIVENRAGASGTIGGSSVMQSAPDGYTVLFSSNTHSMTKLVMAKPPYDPLTDFTSIARVGQAPLLDRDVDEDAAEDAGRGGRRGAQESGQVDRRHARARLARTCRDHPVHAPGQGQSHRHALSRHRAGADRRGRRPHPAPHRRDRGAAAAGARRQGQGARGHRAEAHAIAPDVPTGAESGLPGLEVYAWYGFWGPKDMPAEMVQRLNAECNERHQRAGQGRPSHRHRRRTGQRNARTSSRATWRPRSRATASC